jgi:hypothetical protein
MAYQNNNNNNNFFLLWGTQNTLKFTTHAHMFHDHNVTAALSIEKLSIK